MELTGKAGAGIQELIVEVAEKITEMCIDEPLDGDETYRMGRLLTIELDYRQGNIDDDEYNDRLLETERI